MRAAFVLLLVACAAPGSGPDASDPADASDPSARNGAPSSRDVCQTRDDTGAAFEFFPCADPAEICWTDGVCSCGQPRPDGGVRCCYPDINRNGVDDRCHRRCADDADCGPAEYCREVSTSTGSGDVVFQAHLCTP